MVDVRYANAMSEVLEYLKGIRQEDIEKIPKKLITVFKENASKDYKCNFDYNKPLKDLDLLDETRGLISMICLNYWCTTEEEKNRYLKKLNDNEIKYQELLRQKYNPDDLFSKRSVISVADKNDNHQEIAIENDNTSLIKVKKQSFVKKLIERIKRVFKLT